MFKTYVRVGSQQYTSCLSCLHGHFAREIVSCPTTSILPCAKRKWRQHAAVLWTDLQPEYHTCWLKISCCTLPAQLKGCHPQSRHYPTLLSCPDSPFQNTRPDTARAWLTETSVHDRGSLRHHRFALFRQQRAQRAGQNTLPDSS